MKPKNLQLEENIDANSFTKNVETGTWIPELKNRGSGGDPAVTYNYRIGTYFKIGKMVVVTFKIQGKITQINGDNYAAIGGLPFPVISETSMGWGNIASAYNLCTLYGGGAMSNLPSLIINGGCLSLQSSESLGGVVSQFKITPSNDVAECFGGAIYETAE